MQRAMAPDVLARVDGALGDGLERAIAAHHRRRLRRHGRSENLDPPRDGSLWASGHPPPRAGNALDVLIDGATALPAMAEAIQAARSHVHICSWNLEHDFAPERAGGPRPIRALLAELAERVDVRVLMWSGAPLPVFAPRRGQVRAQREALVRGTRIQCSLDSCVRPLHCHHEKLVVIDDEVAFVGGIDMTALAGDRYDSSEHPVRPEQAIGWHDAAVRVRGPLVGDVARHIAMRWEAATGQALGVEDRPAAGDVEAQLVRTLPEGAFRALPNGQFSALETYVRALRSAERLIHLENQFLWSPEVVSVLEDKLRDPPSDAFRLVVVLPAKANNGQDDTRGQVGRLLNADGGAGRFLPATLYSRSGERSGPLYVHAKIGIVDDRWLTIGSANLNEHSLFNDTEVNVVTCDAALARATRLRLWAEHLECEEADVAGDPATVLDERWRAIASEQRRRREAGAPLTHHLVEMPGVSRRAARLLGPVQALVVDG